MRREIDESWIEEAIERYQRIEQLQGDFEKALARVEVSVHSPDGLVALAVSAGGEIRDVTISESAQGRSMRELSRAVHQAIMAAADAAGWARAKVRQDVFGPAQELGAMGFGADLGRTR